MGLKRSALRETGAGSAVQTAPEESLASAAVPRWIQDGPAPAGALLRGYRAGDGDLDAADRASVADEDEMFLSRRTPKLRWWRRLPVSLGGRIALGTGIFAGLAVIALAVAETRDFLLHDPRFEVASSTDIETSGNSHLTRGQLLRVFGADLERNTFRISLADRRSDLERLPWVERATVMRLLPNRLRVQIMERVPVAFVRQGTQVGLVDSHGVLLDMPAARDGETYSFPVLTGVAAADPLSTRAARMALYGQFMKALESGGKDETRSLSEVDLSDPEDVRALIAHGSGEVLVHFGDEEYLKRYRAFAEHADEWQQQHPRLASVDMRYDGQVVLGMGNVTPAPVGEATTPTPLSPASVKVDPAPGVKKANGMQAVAVVPAAEPVLPRSAPNTLAKVEKRSLSPAKKAEKPEAVKVSRPNARQALDPATAHPAPRGAGFSTSNERMFAALAAEHRALATKNAGGASR